MTPELLLTALLRLTLLSSVALLLMMALRPLLQRAGGARAAYAAWLVVPLVLASPGLPVMELPVTAPLAFSPPQGEPAAVAEARPTSTTPASAGPIVDGQAAALLGWIAGAVSLAWLMAHRQRRYRQSLRRDAAGQWRAPAGHSAAVVGLWPARLVLPADFEQRFDAESQRLMLAHETVHLRRHDNAWNLLAAGLLCLQWFNPLAWWGWQRLRADQELACDETVLDTSPEPAVRAAYGEALLVAHAGPSHPALASAWASRHPLVQRVAWLAQHRRVPGSQRIAATAVALGVGLGVAVLARAAQEPPARAKAKTQGPQGLVLNIDSQIGTEDWQHSELRVPMPPPSHGTPTGLTLQSMQPGWCLHVGLYAFGDGEVRPTVLAMDETCQRPLGEGRTVTPDGSLTQFAAQTPQGALQAQVSARWMSAAELAAAARQDQGPAPALSAAQRQNLARQRAAWASEQQQLAAQDKAWRAAREAQAGTR